jgi:hypothetical protein
MWKEDLLTDTTFNPCWFLLDYTFKEEQTNEDQLSMLEIFSTCMSYE